MEAHKVDITWPWGLRMRRMDHEMVNWSGAVCNACRQKRQGRQTHGRVSFQRVHLLPEISQLGAVRSQLFQHSSLEGAV
ncbi:MAG: hypothetical protein ACK5PF_06205 [bacterium]|jgi:hypothetical protein